MKRGKLHLSELVQSVSTEGRQGYHEELCLTFIVRNPELLQERAACIRVCECMSLKAGGGCSLHQLLFL